MRTRYTVGCAVVIALFGMTEAFAQDINEAVTIEDLGFTRRLNAGARAAGMAGAYSAIGGDIQSLVYNPAGLARIDRGDLSIGFQHQKNNLESNFFGTNSNVDVTATTLDFVAGAYPVPTKRGSFVLAAGVYRTMSSQLDLLNRGFNTETNTFDDYRLQQSGNIWSYNFGAAIDLSDKVSAGANLFVLDGTISALTQFSFEFASGLNTGDLERDELVDDAIVNLDGYGAILGLQYDPHRLLHFGFAIATPVPITLQGDALQTELQYFYNAPDSIYEDAFVIESEYQLPYRVDFGVAFTSTYLIVSADAGYTDWTQAEVFNGNIKDSNLQPVFQEVLELRAGAELRVPFVPLALRAGYGYLPYPLEYLQADRITGDQIREADVSTERQLLTAGIGVILGRAVAVDAAAEYTVGGRAIATLEEDRSSYRLLLSGSYRF